MAGMGPPPKAPGTRARRNAAPQVTTLPAGGRTAKVPPWPLQPDIALRVDRSAAMANVRELKTQIESCQDVFKLRTLRRKLAVSERYLLIVKQHIRSQSANERKLWAELWKTPQAAMWEKLAWGRDVAQYVRHKVRAEAGSLDDAKEARQWSDRLGLNPLAMLRLRWETERAEDAEARGQERRSRPATQPARPSLVGKDDPRSALTIVR